MRCAALRCAALREKQPQFYLGAPHSGIVGHIRVCQSVAWYRGTPDESKTLTTTEKKMQNLLQNVVYLITALHRFVK